MLYELLPTLAAQRIVAVLQRWQGGALESHPQDVGALRYCSSAQLRRERQLDWSWEAPVLARWVHALMPFAPAHFIDSSGRRREVRAAIAKAGSSAVPGTVLERQGARVRVACWADRCGWSAAGLRT